MNNERCSAYYVAGVIYDTHICGETNATASTCSSDNGKTYGFLCVGPYQPPLCVQNIL